MKFVITLIILIILLGILIVILSNKKDSNVSFPTGKLASVLQNVSSNLSKNDPTIGKPSSLIITRVNADTLDLNQLAKQAIPPTETLITSINQFPAKLGSQERKGSLLQDEVFALPGCSSEQGVSKAHIWVKRNYANKTSEVSYTIENIAEDNEIQYYCNDDNIPESKKCGYLFNNVSGEQENDDRNCLVFHESITLALGQAVIRIYRNEAYTKINFKSYIDSQSPSQAANATSDTPSFVIKTNSAVTNANGNSNTPDDSSIVIQKRRKEINLD